MLTINNPESHDWANMSLSDLAEGNSMDTHYTLRLFHILKDKMEDTSVFKFMNEVLMPVLGKFAEVEATGLDVDTSRLDDVGRAIRHQKEDYEDELYSVKGVQNTDKLAGNDLIEILYTREGGLELYPSEFTEKSKKPSTAAPGLKLLLKMVEEELSKR